MWIDKRKFHWLRTHGVLSSQDGHEWEGGVVLSANCVEAIVSGRIVARVLGSRFDHKRIVRARVGGLIDEGHTDKVEQKDILLLQQLGSAGFSQGDRGALPFNRLYTWNAVAPILSKLNLSITAEDKTLMVAGDEEVALRTLEELVTELEGRPPKRTSGQSVTENSLDRSLGRHQSRRGHHQSRRPQSSAGKTAGSPVKVVREVRSVMEIRDAKMDYSLLSLMSPQQFAAAPHHRPARSLPFPDPSSASLAPTRLGDHEQRQSRGVQLPLLSQSPGKQDSFSRLSSIPAHHVSGAFHTDIPAHNQSSDISPSLVMSKRGGATSSPGAWRIAELLGRHAEVHVQEAWLTMTESVRARVKTFVWEGVGWTSRQVTPGANRKFLQCVLDESETTAAYLQTNHGSTNDVADLELVLGAVHWGLMSRSSDTAQLSCMALTRLAKSLKSMAEERWQAHLWSWFAREQTSQSSGMTAACACLKAHGTGLGAELSELFAAFCTHHLHDTFRTALPALLRGPGEYAAAVTLLARHMSRSEALRRQLAQEGALVAMAEQCMAEGGGGRGAEASSTQAARDRVGAVEGLVEVWLSFPRELPPSRVLAAIRALFAEGQQHAQRRAGQSLQRERAGASSFPGARAVLGGVACLFTLLDALILHRCPEASLAYKLAAEALVQHYQSFDVRELLMRGLARLLAQNPAMPAGILVMPVLQQVKPRGWEDSDTAFAFFLALARHPSLSGPHAVAMTQVLVPFVARGRAGGSLECLQELLRRHENVQGVQDAAAWLARKVLGCRSDELEFDQYGGGGTEERAEEEEVGWASWSGTSVGGARSEGSEEQLRGVSMLIGIVGLGCQSVNERLRAYVRLFLRKLPSMQPQLAAKAITLAELLRIGGEPAHPGAGPSSSQASGRSSAHAPAVSAGQRR